MKEIGESSFYQHGYYVKEKKGTRSLATYLKVYIPGTRDLSCKTGESAPELIILFLSFKGPFTSSHLYSVILSSSELSGNQKHTEI